jgi:hypothetical protein
VIEEPIASHGGRKEDAENPRCAANTKQQRAPHRLIYTLLKKVHDPSDSLAPRTAVRRLLGSLGYYLASKTANETETDAAVKGPAERR